MKNSTDYNEDDYLVDYVIRHYSYLCTKFELLGFQTTLSKSTRTSQGIINSYGAENDPKVVEALLKGRNAFRHAVYTRLMKDHGNEIFINRCPTCNKAVKTPKAKQCHWCFESWHSKK